MDKKEKFRLEGEEMREAREFRQLIIENIAREIGRLLPGGTRNDPDAAKAAEMQADTQWARARSTGARSTTPQDPRNQQQR